MIFNCVSDLNSPSIVNEPTASLILLISSSDHSDTCLLWSTPAISNILEALLFPIPKMYVSDITPLLFFGMSIPAILAIILTLSLFKSRILLVYNIKSPFSSYNFTICTSFFYWSSYFHFLKSISYSCLSQIIRTHF